MAFHERPDTPAATLPTPAAPRVRTGPGATTAGLLRACHPLPTLGVTTLATGLAAIVGHLPPPRCGAVALAVLAGQLSVGWSNDALDARRDRAAGRADKPVATGLVTARAVWTAALTALVLCGCLSCALGVRAGGLHLLAVAAAWAYNLGLKATVWSWLPYAVAFGALPVCALPYQSGAPPPDWRLVGAGALLGVGAHLANVLPDLADDLRHGMAGLPQRLGPRRLRALLPLPPVAAALLVVTGAPVATAARAATVVAAGALATGATVLASRWPRLPFLATMAIAVLLVVTPLSGPG